MGDVPPLVAIKEANTHLQALHDHNQLLEKEVIELRAALSLQTEKNTQGDVEKQQLEEVIKVQGQQIEDKSNQIVYLKSEIDNLNKQLEANCKLEMISNELRRKVDILNEILKYKSALESVTLCLEQVEVDFIKDIESLVHIKKSGGAEEVKRHSEQNGCSSNG